MRPVGAIFMTIITIGCQTAYARFNQPCSGSKGDASDCSAEEFLCRDGAISQSSKTCMR